MTNPEHVEILRQGVEVWNKWRKESSVLEPDLAQSDFSGMNLSGIDLNFTKLTHANFSQAILHDSEFTYAKLDFAKLDRADLKGADFSEANLRGAHLSNIDLTDGNLSLTNAQSADFRYANLSSVVLNYTDFQYSGLCGAKFNDAWLDSVNFTYAELRGADFNQAHMEGVIFGDRDLREIKGLNTVQHTGPSPLSINSISLSRGNLPEVFVRGTGAPKTFVEYMHSLIDNPIQYYTCFISYSSKDNKFVQRLHADLQDNGVNCWFAPHDMKIGDKIRQRIDESIRMYEKLLLILSPSSVRSAWVEAEVEKAFDKEKRKKKEDVLFPIRLDDAVMRTKQAWASEIKRTRHIGDFTNWKDHDSYQEAFNRLLRDLKAEGKEVL